MNNSGISVKKLSDYYKIQKENIIVVQDDMDLDIGVVKAKYSQGDGGHKGIRSINSCLNFSNYLRIKVGIGKPKRKNEVVDFVLSKFSLDEQDSFNNSLAEASKLLVYIVSLGYDKGLNKYYSQIDKQNKEDKSVIISVIGRNFINSPIVPGQNTIGKNANTVVKVDATIGQPISSDAA